MKSLKKRFAALFCAATMIVSAIPTAFPMTAKAEVLSGFDNITRQVAAEGCVLLENDNDVLPLKKGTKVSIFGRSQCHYDKFRVFAGSGDGVKVDGKYAKSILDALKDESISGLKVNSELVDIYKKWVSEKDNKYKKSNKPGEPNSDEWKWKALSQTEMPLTDKQVSDARNKSDTAIVIISRLSGEECDTSFEKGRYYLQDAEEDMIKKVTSKFDKVVVLLNVTCVMDMSWVDKYGVESVMYVWNGGQNGGLGVADVISGKVNPSGKMADTIAKTAEDYPTYKNYGGEKVITYEEDIYVGYRYFETFAPDKVAYGFGYGLSYTDFDITTNRVDVEDGYVKAVVSVTNTGKVAGKEVVQVYYGAPQNQLGNPVKELAAFAKTRELQPGETQNMSLNFKISEMASYDDGGVTGHESAYVLEAGDYKIYVGNSVRDSELVHTYNQKELEVVEQLTEAAAPYHDFERMKAVEKDGKIVLEKEKVPKIHTNVEQRIKDNLPKELKKKDNNKYNLIDVYNGKLTMEQFVAQMSNDDLASLLQGNQVGLDEYMGGSGSPFGGVLTKDGNGRTTLKKKYGIPVVTCVDGPAGAKIKTEATLIPSGNVIGCTWNLELIEELGRFEGQEMVKNNVDNLLGPGINIHRDPRNGRNPEYYSEDPLLTGRLAAVITKGIQECGATATGKHMACNNQDNYRRSADSRVSERALREIYMKPFEIYVKEGHGRAIMTAYNPINGCYAAGNYDLNTTIVRNEWKYDGMIMTDWWADSNKQAWANGDMWRNGEMIWVMIRSGGDIFMFTQPELYDKKGNPCKKIENLFKELEKGSVTRAEMQRSAVNVLNLIIESQAFARDNKIDFAEYAKKFVKPGEDWFKVEQAELGNPQVKEIKVGGRKITSFNQKVLEYKVYASADAKELPKVEATAEDGTTLEIEQATKDNKVATIKATEGKATKNYRIVFTDEENLTPVLENPVLAEISDIKVNGKSVDGFDTAVSEYSVAVASLETEPKITCTAPEGVVVKATYDKNTKTATIKGTSADQAVSYKLNFGVAPQSDEFEGDTLKDCWKVTNENKSNLALKDGHLVIGAEFGSIWENQDHLKNQVIQSAHGNWEAVVKIDLPKLPSQAYQSLGAIAMQDQNNYVYVKLESDGNGYAVALCEEKDGKNSTLETISEEDEKKFTDTMYIKMQKLGNTYISSVSPDGKEYIRFTKAVSGEYADPKFMLVNGNGDKELSETLEAKFDYVKFKTEGLGDVVTIEDDTKLKLAEAAPVAMSSALRPAPAKDGGFYLTGTSEGEYIVHNIDVKKSGYYDLVARFAADTSDTQQMRMVLYVDGKVVADQFRGGTGGAEEWVDFQLGNTKLTAGTHQFKIEFLTSAVNLNWMEFKLTKELDDAGLGAAIAAAKAKDMSAYTEESQQAYAAAIQAAEAVLKVAEAKEEFEEALAALKKAEESLIPLEDETVESVKVQLKAAVEAVKDVFEAGQGVHQEEDWKRFVEAYNAAANPPADATVETLKELKKNLELAEAKLSEKPGTGTDAEALAAELKKAAEDAKATFEAGQGEYTDESWKAFADAYNKASNPAADATAETLAQLKTELTAAKAALKKKGNTTTEDAERKEARTKLEETVAKAREVYDTEQDKYTEESWNVFKKAYDTANDTLNNANATVDALNKCSEALAEAQNNLKKKDGTGATKEDPSVPDGEKTDPTQGNEVPTEPGSTTKGNYIDQVQVTVDKSELYVGGDIDNKTTVHVNVPNGAAIQNVMYHAVNAKVAGVDADGKVTAKKKGNTVIAATVTLTNGETKTFYLDIAVKKAYIEKVSGKSTIKKGKKMTLKAVAYGSSKRVTWKLKSGSKYAKLTRNGKFTAKAKGKVKVVAKAGKVSKTFTIRIK